MINDITGKTKKFTTTAKHQLFHPPKNSLFHFEVHSETEPQIVSSESFTNGIAIRAVGDFHPRVAYQQDGIFNALSGEFISIAVYGGTPPYTIQFYIGNDLQDTAIITASGSIVKSVFKNIGEGYYMIRTTDFNALTILLAFKLVIPGFYGVI